MTAANSLWTSDEIAAATGGHTNADFVVYGLTFDSREVGPGDLFLALHGENDDGNRFVEQAFAAGAAGAIVDTAVAGPHILVTDTMAALEALGRAARVRSKAQIIGITGSVGKTGTKEALAEALERYAPGAVHCSVKSYNNHTGVPLSLARMPRDCDYGVFEMGMNHAGELAALTAIVRPHVAVITTVAPAHIGYFASLEAIADAKAEVFSGLESHGTAIIPFDSPFCDRLASVAEAHGAQTVTFGTQSGANVCARDWVVDAETGGSLITAELPDATLCFALAPPGDHWVANAMAVLAAVQVVGADLAAAGLALAELSGLQGRGARHHIDAAGGEVLLIDESYNANPASMAATLKQLGREPAARRIAVLGAMKELGEGSEAFHAALVDDIIAAKVDMALLVGEEMRALALVLVAEPLAHRVEFAHDIGIEPALEWLRSELRGGDVVLVKGSNSIGLSRIVTALIGGDI
ncbi:MAG: UDP-N-acetylmuramoyl-tripeptide--D-alanyl-D-alanine ligase [Pseudomonadota bacterium]